MGLREVLLGKRVYLDANIFIYLLEGSEQFKETMAALETLLAQGSIKITTSALSLTELLPHHAKRGDTEAMNKVIAFLNRFDPAPVSQAIAIHAGVLRGETGMKTPDAIHVATAMQNECEVFLTNDKGIHTPLGMEQIILQDFA